MYPITYYRNFAITGPHSLPAELHHPNIELR